MNNDSGNTLLKHCGEPDIPKPAAAPSSARFLEVRMSDRDCDHGQLARSCNICHLEQEVTMLRQEYAADTAEIAKLNAMLDEHRGEIAGLKAMLAEAEAINSIDARFCGRLALILECAILDPHGHFELACQLLEEYKAEWEKVHPSPPTFMGEPMPPERRARLLEMKAIRNEQEQSE